MARMIPTLDAQTLAAVSSAAEREVYRAMRDNLPSSVWVLHGLSLLAKTRDGALRDLEADFVVFDRDQGLLVVEVKGGGVSFDPRTSEWHSIDRHRNRHEIKDPFAQARRAMYAVLYTLKEEGRWPSGRAPRLVAAHGALFPDLVDVGSLVRPGIDVRQIGGAGALEDLSKWCATLFAAFRGEQAGAGGLGSAGMQVIDQLFCRPVVVQAPLALAIRREARRQVELTVRQALVLRSLSRQRHALVAGGAGTGKTLLALEQARDFARKGLRTALLCFSRPLGKFLERQNSEDFACLTTCSFHKLAYDWIERAKREHNWDPLTHAREEHPNADHYDTHMPMGLAYASEVIEDRFDALVVDEGQDLPPDAWFALQLLLTDAEESRFLIFYDPNQAVYGDRSHLPITKAPFLLVENCRNTRPIHEAAYRHYKGDAIDPPDIEGAGIELIKEPTPVHQARVIRRLVGRLVTTEKVAPEQIAVLLCGRHSRGRVAALQQAGRPSGACWSHEQLWVPGAVLVDTAHRFKGLEAAAVILWLHDTVDANRDVADLYVGLSRARSRLWVVGAPHALKRIGLN
ncbi:MAG: AAA family ATPase [Planctomycetes bacterium]|nr:AAA family ATPase [Planctomycetota bacterium]